MLKIEDVIEVLDKDGKSISIPCIIPQEFIDTLLGKEEPKERKPHICVICGGTIKEAGAMRCENEDWYCNGSKKDCWGTIYEEDTSGIHRERVTVYCPFCETRYIFKEKESVKGTCSCGAEFYEGYEEIVHFKRRKK